MSRTIHWLVALLLAICSMTSAYTIKPTNYTLDIFVDTNTDVFTGTVEILANVLTGGAGKFVLHNHGLNPSVILVNQKGSEIFQSVAFDDKMQTMEVRTSSGLVSSSTLKITITYSGNVSTDGTGLYMFRDSDGNKIYMTNFYPIYARKFFPCIDEPGSNATIAVTITVPSANGKFIASSAVTESKASNGYQVYQLDPIVSVSPYSLFFTMGRWDNSYQLPVGNVTLWLPQSLKSKTSLIDPNLIVAVSNGNITNLMHFMPQNILNILVTPVLAGDSYSGMSAVVLKADIVINDLVETTTEEEKQHLIKISYALYKMFFGTLVQPSNWGNNWLSDSISTYLAYHALDSVDSYGSSDATLVTDFDEHVLRNTWGDNSPVTYLATSPTEPKAILEFINGPGMTKGAYTIKTLETLFNKKQEMSKVIESVLLFGLSNIGKVVDTQSFIKSMDGSIKVNASGVTVGAILQPMIEQSGYPLISLNRADLTLTLERTNFYYTNMLALPGGRPQTSKVNSAGAWLVPITLTTSNDPSTTQVTIYFYSPNTTTPLAILGAYDKSSWALLNIDGKGMLRVDYDDQSWANFAEKTTLQKFTPASKAKLVTDAFAAAESGVQSWVSTLKFLEYLDQETDIAPWKAALQGFSRMWTWIYPTGIATKDPKQADLSTPFKAYMSKRLQNLYQNLGTTGKNGDSTDPLRRLIVGASCDYGNSSCVPDLAAQYQKMVSGSYTPTNNMYSVVACNGLKSVQKVDDWTTAYQQYVNSGKWFSQNVIDSHYSILACSNLPDAMTAYMKKIFLNDTLVPFPVNQVMPAVEAIMNRPEHVTDVLNFFITYQNQFSPYITVALQVEIMKALGDRLTVPSQYALLQAFAKNASLESNLVTAINNAVTKSQQNINYIYTVQDSVLAGLTGNEPPPTVSTTQTASTSPTISPSGSTGTGGPIGSTTEKPDSAASITVSFVTIALSVVILLFA